MPLYQAIVLAIVQGLTEFLPISSTAHLALFPWLLGWKDPGLTFDVALHAGTLVAALVYFWRTWLEMLAAVFSPDNAGDPKAREHRTLFWFLLLGTLPGTAVGLLFEEMAEKELREPVIIAAALIAVGMLMWAGENVGTHKVNLQQVSLLDSLIVGVAQALALVPGVSRSGVTMTAGLFRGMSRGTAARFSFLLSTPIIAGAALKKALEMRHSGLPSDMRLPFLAGTAVAALVGYLVVGFLIRYLERRTFKLFAVYRVALGVIVLLVGWGVRHA